MEFWTYLVVIIVVLLFIYFKSWIRAVKLALILPGPRALPLIGNALLIGDSKNLHDIGNKAYEEFGSIFRGWLSFIPFFFIYEPKHLQLIFGNNKHNDKNWVYALMHTFVGEGLITNSGNEWKMHRRLIQPCFHKNILETFTGVFNSGADQLVKDLQGKNEVNITTYINTCILDILHQAVLGIPVNELEVERNRSPFRKGQFFVPYRLTRPWLLLNSIFKLTPNAKNELTQRTNLQQYTKMILEKRQQEFDALPKRSTHKSLIEMLMEIALNNDDFTDEDIINETCTFMLAGQDSVGAAIAFTLYFLARNQDVQRKVVEEIQRVSPKEFSGGELKEMQYLEQCIKETLRLCPSVPMFARKTGEDICLGKVTLPAGSNVLISPFITHRLAYIYPDPLKYDPDRFSEENSKKLHPYAFIPFSAGPRNCIGYKFAYIEIKTIISKLLMKYHISLKSPQELNLSYRVTLRAKGGIWLKLTERKQEKDYF